jgi:long-chain acyl-CoA synthetase
MNLAGVIEGHPSRSPAVGDREGMIDYGELRSRVGGARRALRRAGVSPGDRVAVVCPNQAEFVVGYLGVIGLGAVVVPLNPASPSRELLGQLTVVEPQVTLVDDRHRHLEGDSGAAGQILALSSLEDRSSEEATPELEDVGAGHPAALLFTAGTAGAPRPACLTHGNLLANLEQTQSLPATSVSADDVALAVIPLFHVFGLNVVLGLALHGGASVVLVDRFEPEEVLSLVRDRAVTVLPAVPPVFDALSRVGAADGSELARVRQAVSGAAPLEGAVAERFSARFGIPLWQGYGLTEASPSVASTLVSGEPTPGSVGLPLPGVEVRMVDEDGSNALVGDRGEVWVRGPNVFAGYWNDEEATASVLTPDGWLRTGDVGVADDNGRLYLVDRAKDVVIVSGFNVYPAEVEEVLCSCPGVAGAAVTGEADPRTGEAVRAFVVAEAGAATSAEDVLGHCADRLAGYKCPTAVTFVSSLPTGLGGKLVRRAL